MGFSLGKIAAAVNPTAVLGSMATDFGTAVWQTNKANKNAKEAATQAYNRQVQLMDMQNAYNTPAAQMERYKEAGLNPNLIYGQQNLSAGASSVPQAKVFQGDARLNFLSALKLGQDLQLGQAQIDQVKTATEAMRVGILKTGAEAETQLWNLGLAKGRGVATQTNSNFYFGILDLLRYMWKNTESDLEKDNYFIPPVKK